MNQHSKYMEKKPKVRIETREEFVDGKSDGILYQLKVLMDGMWWFKCSLSLDQMKELKEFMLTYEIDGIN